MTRCREHGSQPRAPASVETGEKGRTVPTGMASMTGLPMSRTRKQAQSIPLQARSVSAARGRCRAKAERT